MVRKLLTFSGVFVATALVLTAVSLASTYAILRHDVDQKIDGQQRATALIGEQIKSANLNSILAFTDQYFIFIIHLRDGRLLFESAKRAGNDLLLWERNRDAVRNEIFSKRAGTLVYPRRGPWQILAERKNVIYQHLPDLDWIVATELPGAVGLQQLLGFYAPWVWGILAGFSLALAWYVTFFRGKTQPTLVPGASGQQAVAAVARKFDARDKKMIHAVYSDEFTQRLVSAAKKALKEPQPPEQPAMPAPKAAEEDVAAKPHEENPVLQQEDPVIEEVEIKDHVKAAAQMVKQEAGEQPVQEPRPEAAKSDEEPVDESKKAAEIYFERIISGGKTKKEKPKPASIIGMALSKKKNREDVDQ
jgi:hypothetical protein